MKYILSILSITLLIYSCDPYQVEDVQLGSSPTIPQFSVTFLDSNTVVVENLSTGNFTHIWDFGRSADGKVPTPETSTKMIDTVTYFNKGDYTITLHVSAESGGGTASNSESITILKDKEVSCTPTIALLTGDCGPNGKCWVFSNVAGAISVGPTPGSSEWFSSPAGGLQAEQYDDSWCFFQDGRSFRYFNNGETVDPNNGFTPVPYTPPTDHTWQLFPGAGVNGEDRIVLTNGSFMGVWDASATYDIVTLTETDLVVRSEFLAGGGWFELYFVAQ